MKKQKFNLPSMVLHRMDVEEFLGVNRSQELSNEEMEAIAKRLSDNFMEYWNDALKIISEEHRNVEG